MSTLGKLKQSLNLTGATKGLENVGAAAKGINMSGLGTAVETVTARFSALEVMGVTALANITNSAVNTGKRMLSALTIDPIKTGLAEYETQINAVQTILANTESKGTTLDNVNTALDTLNTYADKTIYNFTEMTRNIGTFTAAGVDLDTSVNAIQGIANLAAVSGSNSQQASTAMYQLSQALSSGTVKLMDWNSVVNAGMGGQVFQDALKETARVHGVAIDDMIKKNGSFRETLQEGWLTADILTETLSHFTMAAEEGSEQWNEYKKSLMDDGYTEQQANAILKLSNTATDAATKVKTATQLWDTLKETAQSGWTQTWEIILGDFGEAKELFSGMFETLSPIIEKSSEARNALLEGAMTSNWDKMVTKINEAGVETTRFEETLKNTVAAHDIDVNKLIDDYGSLEKAFRSGAVSTDVLKESLGKLEKGFVNLQTIERNLSFGKTGDDVKKIQGILADLNYDLGPNGIDGNFGWSTYAALVDFQKANNLKITGIVDEETITALERANTSTVDLSNSVDDLLSDITKLGGRENLIEGLKNAFDGLVNIVKPIKEAFSDIFPPLTVDQVYGFTENVKALTERFKEFGTKYADQIKRTFKGVFSILDIGKKIITAFGNSISELVKSSGVSSLGDFILNSLASIGDYFTALNENFDVSGVSDIFSKLGSGISSALGKTVDVLKDFGSVLSKVGEWICDIASSIWSGVKTVFGWISENFSIGDIFAGLAGGGIFVLAKKLMGFVKQLSELFDGGLMGALFGKGGEKDGGDSIKDKISELFDGVGEAIQGFTASVKVGSFVAIAAAIAILASAFGKIAELDAIDIGKSLVTMGVSLGIMMKALNGMPKTMKIADKLGKFSESTNLIKSGITLMMLAKAMDMLSNAIVKLSDLSWEELAKGLVGVGGGIAAMCGGLKILNGTKVSLGTSIAMLALAEACKILGDAMKKFVGFSWDEIARGLAGMGGALVELVAALAVLSKVGGFGSMLGATGILIAVQSLSDLAKALKSFAEMQWPEIGRGLAAMGGALVEVAGVTGLLGKLAGFSSIFAAGAILIVVQGLSDMADALKSFGEMQWPEIGRGLAAMGGALAEVAGITGVLGKLAGFSSIFASGAILIVVQGLADLAASFKEFGSMAWGEIGRGFVAMGAALGEVAGITGALGALAGFSSILGGAAIWVTVQSLSDLATSFAQFAAMSWPEIGRGLTAMGLALLEVSAISGALGYLAGLPALLGGGAILLAVQGLGDLADALKKFSEMSWDEIGRGLSAMGDALLELSLGSLLNTFSGFGAAAIAEVAAPLGVLADSIKKWKDVTVPEGLGGQLTDLAWGVMEFTFGGWAAGTIAEVAAPLGTLADSVKKWTGITVAENLGSNLTTLAMGVKEFTFGGMGASTLSEVAPAIGTLADSVAKWTSVTVPENLGANLEALGAGVLAFTFGGSGASSLAEAAPGVGAMADSVAKWTGVTVPENLGTNLSTLAAGVKAFTFGGSGAGSLTEAAPGIGVLADSVKKWVGVTVPEGLVEQLDLLATGIKKFTFGGSGAESIATCASGLGIMADSVKKWTGVTVPENLGTNLETLSDGVKSFTWGGSGSENLAVAASGVGAMADAVKKWTGVTIPEGFSDGLTNLSTAIKNICGVEDISTTVSELSSLASEFTKLAGINYITISEGMASVTTAINDLSANKSSVSGIGTALTTELVNPLKNAAKDMTSVGTNIVDAISTGIKNSKSTLMSSAKSAASAILEAIEGKNSELASAGKTLATKLVNGIKNKKNDATDAGETLANNAKTGARGKYDSMNTAGTYLGSGFIAGIASKAEAAYNAGYALGAAAARGVEDGEQAASPSKLGIRAGKWLGQGFVIGIDSMGSAVYKAGFGMGDGAVDSISKSVRNISNLVETGINSQPTIRPIVDLSDVKAGANAIGEMLGFDSSIGVLANVSGINTMMNRRSQNRGNEDVISAINKLGKELGKTGGDTYQVNGVTYDDGSDIKNFAQAVIRQARIERRV
jgi:tape measure domain-containing protein